MLALAGALTIALAIGARSDAAAPAVNVKLFQFQPRILAVPAGTRVTWTSADDIAHTVTAGTPERPEARFDLPLAGLGASASVTFTERGVHPYHCRRHAHMRGEIRVE
jgi:plastocyanin